MRETQSLPSASAARANSATLVTLGESLVISGRVVDFLTQRIKALRHERLKYRLSIGDYWQGADWLFIQENGKQMSYSTPYSAFQDTIARYNADKKADKQLPAIPFHGLRHTSATLLIASKQDVRTVSSRLGHAQASTTMNIYANHMTETFKQQGNSILNNMY